MGVKDINIDNTPLSEKIAETIRSNIMKGVIKPGERLVEPKLSEQLGISRTPIREALRLLEMEGFIEIIPRRGAIVTQITDKDIDDIFVIKIRLESLAARLSVSKVSDADIERMKELAQKVKEGSTKVTNMVNWNSEFHDIFINNCGNERLIRILEGLQQQFKRATVYSFTEMGRTKQVNEEHISIIEAFENEDEDKVEELVEKHIMNGWNFIRSRVPVREAQGE
ncbi:GntR family transcriptional regulator [Limisalsivibrio acetivorans]|uniref:GntR family transcriptional regulator n=1 Tax=Limisalsivibrio acetivorans TaxID=1304888 RepID=UPI0003B5DF3A|nr:GntR family transcriptional regulator [Limisalsivibrio acetivorans]